MEFTPKLSTREQTMRIYAIYANRILQVPVSLTLFIQKIRMQESAIAVQELTFMIVNQKNNIYSRCITIYP